MSERDGEDRRVQRTKGRLRGAIASLIHEKAYGAIAVKEILARAEQTGDERLETLARRFLR